MTRLSLALAAVLALAPLVSALPLSASQAATLPKRTVPGLTGTVTPGNAARYTQFVADRLDQVVSLRLTVTPGTGADFQASNYLAEVSDDLFMVFKRASRTEGGIEVVLPKAEVKKVGAAYVIEGFFVVRSGGTHQGTLSYGLERMDPAIATAGGAKVVQTVIAP